jgi:hypothetical protein
MKLRKDPGDPVNPVNMRIGKESRQRDYLSSRYANSPLEGGHIKCDNYEIV